MESCISSDSTSPCLPHGLGSPRRGSASTISSIAMNVYEDAAPVFEELVKHSSYELELLMEDAKRYIYIAQMIGSVKPLKKAKRMIKKIKSKLKKQPDLKTKKIEVDLSEFHDNWLSSPDGPTRPERPELGKIKKHIKDILSPAGRAVR